MKIRFAIIIILALTFSGLNAAKKNALVTLNVENADVRDVLQALAQIAGANIVISKDVTGKITIRLNKVPWKTALGIITESAGLSYREKNGIITVTTKDEFETMKSIAKLETRVINLEYSKAKDVKALVEKRLSDRGVIETDSRTNSLIITDLPEVLDEIQALINKLDVPNRQVMISARIVEVDYDAARELGINWSAGNVLDTLAKTKGGVTLIAGGESDKGLVITFGKVLPSYNINATLSQLENESKANILSEPKIMVEDNENAVISSGKLIPVIMRDQAGNPVIKFYDATLKLSVTPHISPNNEIRLELEPQVGDIAGLIPGAPGPIISVQKARTILRVKNGETIVIGGVLKSREAKGSEGIPFLKDLPIIGGLFGSKSRTVEKKEILFFITPRIVEND